MGRFTVNVLSIALVLLVAYSRHAECRHLSKILLIDTPLKFEQLRTGEVGAGYDEVNITAKAHPNVLLQPQYFANASFAKLTFNGAPTMRGNNSITIHPGLFAHADITLSDVQLSLDGVPRHYHSYNISLNHATALPAHICAAIVQWKRVAELNVHETVRNDVALGLQGRIGEMADMYQMKRLSFSLHHTTHGIQPGMFIVHLRTLKELWYHTFSVSASERRLLPWSTAVPENWHAGTVGDDVLFREIYDKRILDESYNYID